ncbi:unnamed protein product [Schistosoma bovis]|nr:unnamed protein product [Schistosoma bovis]
MCSYHTCSDLLPLVCRRGILLLVCLKHLFLLLNLPEYDWHVFARSWLRLRQTMIIVANWILKSQVTLAAAISMIGKCIDASPDVDLCIILWFTNVILLIQRRGSIQTTLRACGLG